MFDIASILITLAGLFSFINLKTLRLPTNVGVMLMALLVSLVFVFAGKFDVGLRHHADILMKGIDFNQVLLHGMLAFLLFAGAFKLELADLYPEWDVVTLLAVIGTILCTAVIGGALYGVVRLLNLTVPLVYCMLFGALISPTDPVAVLSMMRHVGAPKSLQTQITGEALFNDGIAVALFLSLLSLAADERAPSAQGMLLLVVREAGGGILLGLLCGGITYQLVKRVDDYQVEGLLTLGLAMGSYSLAENINVSAPICVVVAGLWLGNRGRKLGMSERTQEHLGDFWELIDTTLNIVLFMLLGLEVLVLPFHAGFFLAGAVAIAVSLLARWLTVTGIVGALAKFGRHFVPRSVLLLTWGGLRGGISLALALSLPEGHHREVLIFATYCVVVFSVLVQGLTLAPLIRRFTTQPAIANVRLD